MRRTFPTHGEAKRWRQEAMVDLRRGRLNAPSEVVLGDAAEAWLTDARAGVARTRSGSPYKPSAIRTYEAPLRGAILPELGSRRLSAVSKGRVQDLVDSLVGRGYSASTVRNAILPLRAIYRRAIEREEIAVNPTARLSLPADDRSRERVVEPREAQALLDSLRPRHRALWATALFTGLRRGELQALAWSEVDLGKGVVRVEHSWDRVAGLVAPKSRSGLRVVPLPAVLRPHLIAHRLQQGRAGEGFVFSSRSHRPFDASNAIRAAKAAWARAGVEAIGFHECRHAYASLMIAAGVNAKALSSYMGHSSITVTLDRYGHLMPGNERQAADLLDAYFELHRKGRSQVVGALR